MYYIIRCNKTDQRQLDLNLHFMTLFEWLNSRGICLTYSSSISVSLIKVPGQLWPDRTFCDYLQSPPHLSQLTAVSGHKHHCWDEDKLKLNQWEAEGGDLMVHCSQASIGKPSVIDHFPSLAHSTTWIWSFVLKPGTESKCLGCVKKVQLVGCKHRIQRWTTKLCCLAKRG